MKTPIPLESSADPAGPASALQGGPVSGPVDEPAGEPVGEPADGPADQFPDGPPDHPAQEANPAATQRATVLLDVMERLAGLFDAEVAAVRGTWRHTLANTSKEKQALARAYEHLARALRVDGNGLGDLDPDLRLKLQETTQTLSVACRRNHLVLKAHSDAHREVVDAIVAAINQGRKAEGTYGAVRGIVRPGHAPRHITPATTFNSKL